MKKTLILLALLLPCPLYADGLTKVKTIDTHSSNTTTKIDTWTFGTTCTTSSDINYTYVALLDVNSLKEAFDTTTNPTNPLLGKKLMSASNNFHYGIGLSSAGNVVFNNSSTNSSIGNPTQNWASLSPTVSLSDTILTKTVGDKSFDLVAATLSFTVGVSITDETTNITTTSSGAAGISLLYADGSTVDLYGTNSGYKSNTWSASSMSSMSGLVQSVTVFSGPGGSTDAANMAAAAQSVISASVPEPATATLSLLALAGLAMRRCRK